MNNFEFLREIVINDEDILSAQEILGSKLIFDSRRKEIIKNMQSVDIQAFPGSGKTTILVVKLVILAKKWILNNSGLCVLSHTNVAREEIEQKIGNNNVGKKILSYPHFIGTFHSFFDTYIAIPWLKSKGYTISIINSEYVQSLRWKRLPCNTKNYLEKHMKNESICTYNRNLGEINWNKNDKAKLQILDVIQKTQKEGYFTFDEMLLYAKQALEEHSTISSSIQQRFPILFIDEAQDTDSLQWDLIQKAFNEDGTSSIRQVFGDSNQAIYNSFFVDEELKYFPRMNALVMNESKRFDSRIANLANTITLSAEQMIGTDNEFTEKKINHTILLFNKKEAKQVINEYGKLILNNFSDDDIRKYHKEGCHAVGMIHIKKKETPEKQFPKGIYDYWENYQIKESKTNKVHNLLIHYFRYGINEFLISGEKHSQISWITEGIRILINKTKKDNFIAISNNPFYALQNVLPNDLHENFRTKIKELCDKNYTTSKSDWESILLLIDKLFKLFDITLLSSQRKFLMWEEENNTEQINNRDNKEFTLNHFTYCDNETKRSVDIEFGSIHSVKGRTHLATLILETYYKTFNIKSILKYMCGINPSKLEEIHIKRLKCHYVAITRARALVCLAIPIDFVDENTRNKLESIGWSIKVVN